MSVDGVTSVRVKIGGETSGDEDFMGMLRKWFVELDTVVKDEVTLGLLEDPLTKGCDPESEPAGDLLEVLGEWFAQSSQEEKANICALVAEPPVMKKAVSLVADGPLAGTVPDTTPPVSSGPLTGTTEVLPGEAPEVVEEAAGIGVTNCTTFGSFLEEWFEQSGQSVVDPSEWRKPSGFKGWGRCPGEANLKSEEERWQDRAKTEQEVLQPMRAFAMAYIRKHGKRPRAADGFTAAGGQALGLYLMGFDVVGFELDAAHGKNCMERDEVEFIPGI
jgi:hypothetical protein